MNVPSEGDKLHVTRFDSVAEALSHLGVAVSVASERGGLRVGEHFCPCACRITKPHLDPVGLDPLGVLVGRASLRHCSVNLNRHTHINLHPAAGGSRAAASATRGPGLRGTEHGLSVASSSRVTREDA